MKTVTNKILKYSRSRYLIPYISCILPSYRGELLLRVTKNGLPNLLIEVKYVIVEFSIRVFISVIKE